MSKTRFIGCLAAKGGVGKTTSSINLSAALGHFGKSVILVDGNLTTPNVGIYLGVPIAPVTLHDVLRGKKDRIKSLAINEEELNLAVLEACSIRYKGISGKVRRAIIRSVIFILCTKAIFALSVEGTFERFLYGRIIVSSMLINILVPPILMVIVGLMIKIPTKENSFKILKKIQKILYEENPILDSRLVVKKRPSKADPVLGLIFVILWLVTFALSFGAIIYILTRLQVNPLSQVIFIFFLAIVSFVSYRINQTANMYMVKDKIDNFGSLLFDFFFMPFIYVGRRLTTAIAQVNIILFIFDFIIETPFKGIFAFFEQWFLFLRNQREKLY